MSVKFVSAILGPEMAAPILWTPGKKKNILSAGKPMSIKFCVLGGGFGGVWGGGSADFIFMGARIFLSQTQENTGANENQQKSVQKLPPSSGLSHLGVCL